MCVIIYWVWQWWLYSFLKFNWRLASKIVTAPNLVIRWSLPSTHLKWSWALCFSTWWITWVQSKEFMIVSLLWDSPLRLSLATSCFFPNIGEQEIMPESWLIIQGASDFPIDKMFLHIMHLRYFVICLFFTALLKYLDVGVFFVGYVFINP